MHCSNTGALTNHTTFELGRGSEKDLEAVKRRPQIESWGYCLDVTAAACHSIEAEEVASSSVANHVLSGPVILWAPSWHVILKLFLCKL